MRVACGVAGGLRRVGRPAAWRVACAVATRWPGGGGWPAPWRVACAGLDGLRRGGWPAPGWTACGVAGGLRRGNPMAGVWRLACGVAGRLACGPTRWPAVQPGGRPAPGRRDWPAVGRGGWLAAGRNPMACGTGSLKRRGMAKPGGAIIVYFWYCYQYFSLLRSKSHVC